MFILLSLSRVNVLALQMHPKTVARHIHFAQTEMCHLKVPYEWFSYKLSHVYSTVRAVLWDCLIRQMVQIDKSSLAQSNTSSAAFVDQWRIKWRQWNVMFSYSFLSRAGCHLHQTDGTQGVIFPQTSKVIFIPAVTPTASNNVAA